ncbi:MAG: hypothetical protein IKQ56_01940 [Lachnospiraceae bacterium]|nr:hypothetical protein [Lachnospiraceae bacterium]
MKAVVVEKHDGFAVALRDDGCFVRVKGTTYEIGDKITLRSSRNGMLRKVVAAAAAFAVLVTAGGVGTGVYFAKETYSVVSVDITPSIEYSLNRFDKVIAVRGVNSEGEQIAGEISKSVIQGDLSNALHATMDCLCEKSYITEDEANYMVISVYSKSAKKQESIGVAVAEFSDEETKLCTVTTVNVSKEEKEVADSLGITPGKMILATDAAAAMGTDTSDVDISELASLSVEELTNIVSGTEKPVDEPEQTANITEPVEDKEEPKVSQAVSSDTVVETVSGDEIPEVVSGDDVEIASSSDKSSDMDVSDDKGSDSTAVVSKDKTNEQIVSGDTAKNDSDQSSSKKDDDKPVVSDNAIIDSTDSSGSSDKTENADDSGDGTDGFDDTEADAVSGSKKGDSSAGSEDGDSGAEGEADSEKSHEEGVSVSKPKSSQFGAGFESGNNINISDTEKVLVEDPKI